MDTRRRALGRGALIGGGSGFAACFVAGTALGDAFGGGGGENLGVGLVFGAACVPGGIVYGLIGGALTGRRTEVVLYDPEPKGEAPAVPSE